MLLRNIRYAMVALLVVGSATLLFSCDAKPKATLYDLETLMTESSENRTITMIERGYRTYTFYAPLVEGYSMRKEPYQEFRRGIEMTTYTSDSLALVNAIITANYAIYYENQRLWEAKGDVVIHKFNREEGDTIVKDVTEVYTQQLFWNATTKKIYSNVDTKVLQGEGWHFGVGFDADEDLKNIHFRKYSSEVEFEMNQTKSQADSLAEGDDAPAPQNNRPKAAEGATTPTSSSATPIAPSKTAPANPVNAKQALLALPDERRPAVVAGENLELPKMQIRATDE